MTGRKKPGPAGAFTEALGEAFLALLRKTGNARASARRLGHRHLFNNRMRRDPAFARACAQAAEEASACLGGREGSFVAPLEYKGMPPRNGGPLGTDRPLTIRKTSNGRTQLGHVREGAWTPDVETIFLERLRATGNLRWSARAVGFHHATIYKRMQLCPAFAADCREAVLAAEVRLDYELIAHAHNLLRRPGDPAGPDEPDGDGAPFDPEGAMRILGFIERRRGGRTTKGRRKGPPERSFDEAVASVLAKIAAIKKHKAANGS